MRIIVNGFEWNIVFTEEKRDLLLNGTVRLGITDRNEQVVYLYDGLQGKLLEKVLLHELVHVWIFSYGYEMDVELEEFLCEFVDTYALDIVSELVRLLSIHSEFGRFVRNV